MAEENLRSRHAFGNSENIDAAIQSGKIDSYDILFLDGDTDPKLGWVDRNGNVRIVDDNSVVAVDSLPEVGEIGKVYIYDERFYYWNGTEFCAPADAQGVSEDVVDAKIKTGIETANQYADEKLEVVMDEVENVYEDVDYEISNTPEGTLVDYREKEIRVMCPANTVWTKQSVGSTGNANMYYMSLKAYAPDGAVGFKEGDQGVIEDEMFDFTGDFAGTDKYGRNYSIVWLSLASYDEASDTWTYFGKNSAFEKYIGWTYCVEWYDANGVVMAYNSVRINLSNEDCHYEMKPYYMADISKEIDTKIEERIAEVESAYEIVEF